MPILAAIAKGRPPTKLLDFSRSREVIIQTQGGQQFALLSLDGWESFAVGESGRFPEEVKATAENKALVEFLAARQQKGKRISLTEVKKQLELN